VDKRVFVDAFVYEVAGVRCFTRGFRYVSACWNRALFWGFWAAVSIIEQFM